MIHVTLDIAGMYFDHTVAIHENSTVKNLMDKVKQETSNSPRGARFDYLPEPLGKNNQVNSITVEHRNGSAESRQTRHKSEQKRFYSDGIYSFADDMVVINGKVLSVDPNKSSVSAWQYYVYDKHGNEQARNNKDGRSGIARKIVAFDASPTEGGYELKEGSCVVWRLVTIFVRPSHSALSETFGPKLTCTAE